jgi:hypothetical protein
MTKVLAAMGLFVALVACGSSPEPKPLARSDEQVADDAGTPAPNRATRDESERDSKRRRGKDSSGGRGAPDHSSGGGGSTDAPAPRARAVRPPAPGTYTYAQQGWEEVCQAGACDRTSLPPEQRVTVEHQSSDGTSFRTSTRGAGAREQTIAYSLAPRRLMIGRITADFSFRAFRTRTDIVPEPPILTARLPFRAGTSWSGDWRDANGEVDGTYEFAVRRRDAVGRRRAFVVDTSMTFRGTYRGSSDIRLWVDPRDLMILASRGKTQITGDFGTYRTNATTSLAGRP